MSAGLGARTARAARGVADAGGAASRRCSSRCSSWSSTSARRRRSSRRPRRTFLKGQGYGAFQLPSSLLLAASFGTAALFLVEDIEGGYFDKLRATPVPRTVDRARPADRRVRQGRADRGRDRRCSALVFGITIASGVLGFVLLVALTALWAVVFVGFMQLIALKTRSAAATNSGGLIFFPLLFLTPNFVPRDLLTRPMEIAATLNPVTYVMEALRSLILEDLDWARSGPGFLVVAVARRADARPQRARDQPATTEVVAQTS